MPKNQTVQVRVNSQTIENLKRLSSQSQEFQSETVRKALALYLEAMSDADNKVLIVNDLKKTKKEIILA
ncbi:hypothetical protein [Synechococcus sp. ROS8604]|uniref:hypothetical protein n=1 Tax=Synechococcus sp. ROS8604 TaxID=1442557 RepID=UPI001644A3A9|nr:hypothetical protein [Synechococcus sp. ROS8604]QNI89388.1 hypothetical protein SynROS8604_02765 [Synechococcus sp. ROS8604]